MILIYTEHISERLSYTCHFILKEQLGLDFTITNNIDEVNSSNLTVVNYSKKIISNSNVNIQPQDLLFEEDIKIQNFICEIKEEVVTFFKTEKDDFGFDVFAAVFYLISRYEEYLPHEPDEYDRYDYKNSLAYKNNFIDKPVINIWIQWLGNKIKEVNPNLTFYIPPFKTIVSYDIDMAWSYKNKGILRNFGGFISKPSLLRLKVLLGINVDPFDSFDFLDSIHKTDKFDTIYFFLVAKRLSKYDKNISPNKKAMKNLIKKISTKYNIGLHPSWNSNKNKHLLLKEKKKLESIANKNIINSRQHYIKFNLPDTYRNLLKCGIHNDFSMGYGSINGFRASVASSFFWFDLKENKTTSLRVYPFCFMDATSHYSLHQTAKEGLKELLYYQKVCEKVNGIFIPIFHNNIIGDENEFKGWKEAFTKFIKQL